MAVSGQRVGRAVLELVTDDAKYQAGLVKARAQLADFAKQTYALGRATADPTRQAALKAQAWGSMLKSSADATAAAQAKAAQATLGWTGRLTQLTRQTYDQVKANASLKGSFSQVFAGMTAATLVANGISRVTGELLEMARVGERLPGMRRSFEQLAAGVGESSADMLASLRAATKGLVADFDLMQASNKALLLGLPVNSREMGKLAETATVLGRAMGQDATKSLDDLITALGRSSPMILDNLGLTVKLGEANEAYAAKLGKSASELTEQEQKLAFYEAALRAAEDKVRTLGDVQLTLTDRWRQGRTDLANYVAEMAAAANQSKELIAVYELLEGTVRRAWAGIRLAITGTASVVASAALATATVVDEIAKMASRIPGLGGMSSATTDARNQLRGIQQSFHDQAQESLDVLLRGQTKAQQSTKDLSREYAKGTGVAGAYASATKKTSGAMSDAAQEARRLAEEVDRANTQYRAFVNELGEREFEDIERQQRDIADSVREESELFGDRIDRLQDYYDKAEREEQQWRAYQNEMGERAMEAEAQRLEEMDRQRRQRIAFWTDMGRDLMRAATSNLSGTLFGFGHDPEGSLKKAAQEAREAYEELTGEGAKQQAEAAAARQKWADAQKALEDAKARKAPAYELQELSRQVIEARVSYQEIAKAGTASAEEIQDAYNRMREAEEAAQNGFGTRMVSFWRDTLKPAIINVFDSILQAFVTKFLDGMINAIMGKQGGFLSAFSGLLGGGGGGGGGGILSGLLGRGGGAVAGLLGGASAASAGGVLASASVPISASMIGASGAGAAGAGGAAAGGGGLGSVGALLTNPWTAAGVGAVILGMSIWKKGLFRGGWEKVEGNKRRDQFKAQWGPPGTGLESGHHQLAAFLTEQTGEEGGGRLFADLNSGDKKRFEAAEAAIVELAHKAGKTNIQAFHAGGAVPGWGEQWAKVLGGEGVLSRLAMSRIGGAAGLAMLNAPVVPMPQLARASASGGAPAVTVHLSPRIDLRVASLDPDTMQEVVRSQIIPELNRSLERQTDGLAATISKVLGR